MTIIDYHVTRIWKQEWGCKIQALFIRVIVLTSNCYFNFSGIFVTFSPWLALIKLCTMKNHLIIYWCDSDTFFLSCISGIIYQDNNNLEISELSKLDIYNSLQSQKHYCIFKQKYFVTKTLTLNSTTKYYKYMIRMWGAIITSPPLNLIFKWYFANSVYRCI